MIYLAVLLGFVTLWVAIIAGLMTYLHRRSVTCCLQAPCSERCARIHKLRWKSAVSTIDESDQSHS